MPRYRFSRSIALGLAVLVTAGVWAQEAPTPRPSYARMMNIDALLDNHARFLSRRYNLSAEQDEFTKMYLKTKAEEFLALHREEIYDLVDALMDVRSGGAMSPDELVVWGQRAMPVFNEARVFIIEGNDVWRGILTEEQKLKHDEDLRDMYANFATTETQLKRIVTGEMSVEELRSGPRPPDRPMPDSLPPAQVQPPRVVATPEPREAQRRETTLQPGSRGAQPAPPRGATTGPPRPQQGQQGQANPQRPAPTRPMPQRPGASGGENYESVWDAYVRDFIARYQLDEGQTARANAILDDCKSQASQYTSRREAQIRQLDERIAAMQQSPPTDRNRASELAKLNEQKGRLLKPIDDIFEKRLKPRLETLPSTAQRKEAEKAGARPATPGSRPQGARPARPTPAPAPPPPPQQPQEEEDEGSVE